jgi:DNA-binding protein H-NS
VKSRRLASMLLTDLLALRDKVDKVIAKRIAKERSHIEGKLSELRAFGGGDVGDRKRANGKVDGRKRKRGKAPIKYRGPKPGERWSGRGLTPRWLTAYIKAGKKKESFLVGAKKR